MEVLQLKCGVSVNKMVYSGGTEKGMDDWIEIEHSTMTIKTDHKEEITEAAPVNGHNIDPVNDDGLTTIKDIPCVNATNKKKNSTGKSKSKRKKISICNI